MIQNFLPRSDGNPDSFSPSLKLFFFPLTAAERWRETKRQPGVKLFLKADQTAAETPTCQEDANLKTLQRFLNFKRVALFSLRRFISCGFRLVTRFVRSSGETAVPAAARLGVTPRPCAIRPRRTVTAIRVRVGFYAGRSWPHRRREPFLFSEHGKKRLRNFHPETVTGIG